VFDLVEKFAGYGFNKSHSAAYGLVSYQTAWLKTHYPAPFMAAVMTADMQNTDKVVTLIEECRRMKITIILPDVNTSDFTFTVDDDARIVYGLGAVKGLGEGPVQSILDARAEAGPFQDIFEFCRRVDLRKVNKRALEALIKCGAMDSIGPNRARLMASVPEAVKLAEQASRNEDAGMMDLFGEEMKPASQDVYASTATLRDWPEKERLKQEKETLGLYVTGHPFDAYEAEVRRFAPTRIQDMKPGKETRKVAGLVVGWRTMKTKRGMMAIVTLDDRSGRIEATLFSELFDQSRELLHTDRVLILEGEVEEDDFSGGLRLRTRAVSDISEARRKYVRELQINLKDEDFSSGLHHELESFLGQKQQDGCPVVIHYQSASASTFLRLGEQWKVSPDDDSLQQLRYLLGQDRVELRYH
jgi:DNA polymerase-3 subunit alpha